MGILRRGYITRLKDERKFFPDVLRMSAEGLGLIHDASAAERHANLHLIDGQRIDGFKVVGQQHEVGQPSRLDTPAIVFAHAEQGGINGVGLDRFPG